MKRSRTWGILAMIALATACEPVAPKAVADHGRRLQCLPNSSARPAAVSGNGETPKKLSKDDIWDAMKKVEALVSACSDAAGKGAFIYVSGKINADGSMQSAETLGRWANTAVGDCAARAVCTAVFPVSAEGVIVEYPFTVR